jgi:hypothetical protein
MSRRKEITIFQEKNPPIFLVDEDETDLEKYSNDLVNFFMHLNNISILQTSDTAVLIRPSKISSIVVKDAESPDKELEAPVLLKKKPIPKPKKEEKQEVDIITDAD